MTLMILMTTSITLMMILIIRMMVPMNPLVLKTMLNPSIEELIN